jgi:integrase
LPAFGARSLGELSVDDIREFVAELAESVEAGELAAKTVNNALGTLVVCLNSAVDDGLLAVNPALRVQRLPPAHIETYLRLDEIPRYLDASSAVYRPLAEVLIGSGLRISEALALRIGAPQDRRSYQVRPAPEDTDRGRHFVSRTPPQGGSKTKLGSGPGPVFDPNASRRPPGARSLQHRDGTPPYTGHH